MSDEPDTHAIPGRLPTYEPPGGVFYAVRPQDLAELAAKAEEEGDGPPLRTRKGTKPVQISGIEYRF